MEKSNLNPHGCNDFSATGPISGTWDKQRQEWKICQRKDDDTVKVYWHRPTLTVMNVRRTMDFCGSGDNDAMWGGKGD